MDIQETKGCAEIVARLCCGNCDYHFGEFDSEPQNIDKCPNCGKRIDGFMPLEEYIKIFLSGRK